MEFTRRGLRLATGAAAPCGAGASSVKLAGRARMASRARPLGTEEKRLRHHEQQVYKVVGSAAATAASDTLAEALTGVPARSDPSRFAAIVHTAEAGTGMPARSAPDRFAAPLREGGRDVGIYTQRPTACDGCVCTMLKWVRGGERDVGIDTQRPARLATGAAAPGRSDPGYRFAAGDET